MINNACCYDGGGNDDPDAQDCLDKWKEQLEEVCNQYTESSAETFQHEEEYINSLGWETKLKNWNEIIKKTDEKAKTIVKELEFFLEQAKVVCENSKCTTEALEKLNCLVKSIFDCFFTYLDSTDPGLKDRIIEFKKTIDCLNSISDEDKVEVIKCIEAYEQKIILVCDMQDAILTKLLETLKCAYLLSASICGDDGIVGKLEGILDDFKGMEGDEDCEHEDHHTDNGDNDQESKPRKRAYDEDQNYMYPCNDKLAKPKPRFPIHKSKYYKNLEEGVEIAKDKTENLEEVWIESKKKSDKILSHKTSLTEAIKAAEAAENAK